MIKELDKFDACKMLETNATWGHKLSKIKVRAVFRFYGVYCCLINMDMINSRMYLTFVIQISFTEVFNKPSDQKSLLLPAIVQNPYMTLNILLEYCRYAMLLYYSYTTHLWDLYY